MELLKHSLGGGSRDLSSSPSLGEEPTPEPQAARRELGQAAQGRGGRRWAVLGALGLALGALLGSPLGAPRLGLSEAAPAAAAPAGPAARDPLTLTAERYTLPSGLTVLLRRDPAVPRVVVSLWFNVGSKDEAVGRTGFAHLYEHLMFMGTTNVPGGQFDQIMEAEGGNNNASTSNDRTFYYDFGPSHLLGTLLWLEAERLTNLPQAMTDEKVNLQREVVRNERRQSYENRPYGSAELRMVEALYPKGHPYSWPVIGSHQDLINATTQDVKQFFYTYYVPSNATLAVVGDIDLGAARQLIQTYFGWMPRLPRPKSARWAGEPLRAPVEKRVTISDQVALPRVYMTWHAPPVQSPEFAAVQLLAGVLGVGKASRLHSALVVEQKVAGEVQVEAEPLTLGSLLALSATAQQGVSESTLVAAVERELLQLGRQPITARELERARSQLLTHIARQLETPIGQAQFLQEFNAWFGDPNALPRVLARLRQVTPQALNQELQRLGIGEPGRRVTLTVVPAPPGTPVAAEPTLKAAAASGPPAKVPPALRPPIDLSVAPKLGPVQPLVPPAAARFKHAGIDVLLVRRPGAPLLESVVVVPVGEAQSPPERAGLANAVAAMLTEGAGGRSATAFADALEELGATLQPHVTADTTLLSLSVLPGRYPAAAELLADAVLRPAFAEADWQRTRGELLAQLAQLRDEPRYNAERALLSGLYGEQHPYGRPVLGDEVALGKLQAADLARFHRAYYGALTLVVVGDVELSAATAERLSTPLARRFATSTGWAPPPVVALPPPRSHPGLILVDRPGAPQSELLIANLAGDRLDPDRAVAAVANMLLGGLFTSRLNQNLREAHGYTYGAQSLFVRQKDAGQFVAQAAVRSDVTAESLAEMLKELGRLRSELVTPAELTKGQKGEIQRIVAQGERAAGLAQIYAQIARYGLPLDELARQGAGAQQATPAELQRVVRAQIRPAEATVVVVGDAKKLEAKLRAVSGLPAAAAPPQYRDLDGRLKPGRPASP